jgi:hypothetical protein
LKWLNNIVVLSHCTHTQSEGIESEGIESEGIESERIESEGIESEGIESERIESEGIHIRTYSSRDDMHTFFYLLDIYTHTHVLSS